MTADLLKHLGFAPEKIEELTKDGVKPEIVTAAIDAHLEAKEAERLDDIKRGLTPTIREELKEEMEKGLVAEKLKSFKKTIAKALAISETGTKVAESSQEEFVDMIKGSLVPKGTVEEQNKEIADLKTKLAEVIEDHDTIKAAKEALEAEIPVKYIDKSKYNQERIQQAKIKKVADIKDLPFSADSFLDTLDGRLLRQGISLDIDEKGSIVPMKDGKPLQDDKYRAITFESLVDSIYEDVKPQSGGKPGAPAGGGSGGGGTDGKYVSEAQKRMQG